VDGEHAVVLLRPAPQLSYLKQHLPAGDWLEAVAGREASSVGSDAEVQVVERVLAERR
jgi:hypothetical protein